MSELPPIYRAGDLSVGDVITLAKTGTTESGETYRHPYNDPSVPGHAPAKFKVIGFREDGSIEIDFLPGGKWPISYEEAKAL